MELNQLKYFLEVAKRQHVTKSAEKLHIAQPALTKSIHRLEEELGCSLFHREPQGVTLTAAGRAFCEDAKYVAESWRRLQEGTKLLRKAICSSVNIGIGARAVSNGIFEAVLEFFDRHPEIEVTFTTDIGGDMLEALEEKTINLIIDRLPPASMISRPEHFSVFELLKERQCILVSENDPRAGRTEGIPFRELNNCAVVCGPEGSMDDELMRSLCLEHGVRVSRIYRADNIDAVMALVRAGKGAYIGPESFAARYGVRAISMLPETEIALNLICLRQNRDNPLVLQLKEYLKDRIESK